jgi:hypothetical protein
MAKRKDETREEYLARTKEYQRQYYLRNRTDPEYRRVKRGQHHERMANEPEYREHRKKYLRDRYFGRDDAKPMQAGVCEMCERLFDGAGGKRSYLFQDHCHETGNLRGMLCTRCNNGLGMMGDNEAGLLRALEYVRKYAGSTK